MLNFLLGKKNFRKKIIDVLGKNEIFRSGGNKLYLEFLNSLQDFSSVLDVGCGNASYMNEEVARVIKEKRLTVVCTEADEVLFDAATKRVYFLDLDVSVAVLNAKLEEMDLSSYDVILLNNDFPRATKEESINLIQYISRTFLGELYFINNVLESDEMLVEGLGDFIPDAIKNLLSSFWSIGAMGYFVSRKELKFLVKSGGLKSEMKFKKIGSKTISEILLGKSIEFFLFDYPINQYLVFLEVP